MRAVTGFGDAFTELLGGSMTLMPRRNTAPSSDLRSVILLTREGSHRGISHMEVEREPGGHSPALGGRKERDVLQTPEAPGARA